MKNENGHILVKLNEMPALADQLIELMSQVSIFTFVGPLGAGKTTLIGMILKKCGIKEPISSPTFTSLSIYENQTGQKFYHFDLYRMHSMDEFISLGFQEYLYLPNSWAFIEWPGIIDPLLHRGRICHIILDYADENTRLVRFTWEP